MTAFFRKLRDRCHSLPSGLQTAGLVIVFIVGQGLIPVLLFLYSEELQYWWFVLLLIYIVLLILSVASILRKKEMRRLRAEYGDEFFFKTFPKEKAKEEKRAQKRAARK